MDYCRMMISSEDIQKRVSELAREISRDYAGAYPLILTLLKGAFIFLADLVRHLTIPHEVDFVTVSSYRSGSSRDPQVEIIHHPRSGLADRHVLIVDEIIDTGHTVSEILRILGVDDAKSVKICTLLDKPDSREVAVPVHYVGFTIPQVFVVGYGLDFMEHFRSLSYIAELRPGIQLPDDMAESAMLARLRMEGYNPAQPPPFTVHETVPGREAAENPHADESDS